MLAQIKKEFLRFNLSMKRRQAESQKFNINNWDPHTNGEFLLYSKLANKWNIAFDVGANKGEFAEAIVKFNPDCRVICFEPIPELIAEIKSKGIQEVINCAVGDFPKTTIFNYYPTMCEHSSLYDVHSSIQYGEKNSTQLEVSVITLDDFSREQQIDFIDFIKIDTEGNELNVLKGARHLIETRTIGMIQFEYGLTYLAAGTTLKEVYELLYDDYIICHLDKTGLMPHNYSKNLEFFAYSNWVAVSRDHQEQ